MIELPALEDCILSEKSEKGYVYDIEVYPDYFCIGFKNPKQEIQFEITKGKNEIENIVNFCFGKVLIGFNNYYFDDLILSYIFKNSYYLKNVKDVNSINDILFQVLDKVFNRKGQNFEYSFIEDLRKEQSDFFYSIDLMKLSNVQKSLKLVAVSLKYENIQDLPFQWNKNLQTDRKKLIVKNYNMNDVRVSYAFCKHLKNEIELRYNLSKAYNVDLMSLSDSSIANVLFKQIYNSKSSNQINKDLKTERTIIELKECIPENIKFKTRILKKFLLDLKKIVLTKKENEESFKLELEPISFFGKKYQLGVGGIHSLDDAKVFVEDENKFIIDADVTSYYPSIMINHSIKPEHLQDVFVDTMKQIKEERVKAKKEKDKTKSDGLKIVINSVFGKLGSKDSFLYDEKAMLSVTLSGQLYLLMLIESLNEKNFEVISANTDGIITIVPKDKENEYYDICNSWSKENKFELEFTKYKKYVRRDVNNYIAVSHEGTIKAKGIFQQEIVVTKGYRFPVISKALKAYFIDGIPFEDFLYSHNDIYDFCMSQKIGQQFKVEFDGKPIQNSLRFYVSKKGGKLYKWKVLKDGLEEKGIFDLKERKSYIDLCSGFNIMIFNKYEKKNDYEIDYEYYLKELKKIQSEIEKENIFLW